LEEQADFADVLVEDAKEILMEKANNTYVEETSLSDDDDDDGVLDITKDHESGVDKDKKSPPAFEELVGLFGPLEEYAESCGICGAGHFLRKAKLAFFAAHAAKPARQLDIRAFTTQS